MNDLVSTYSELRVTLSETELRKLLDEREAMRSSLVYSHQVSVAQSSAIRKFIEAYDFWRSYLSGSGVRVDDKLFKDMERTLQALRDLFVANESKQVPK